MITKVVKRKISEYWQHKCAVCDRNNYLEFHHLIMILEIPTTTQDLSSLDNSMAKMIMETINNMLIELYATIAQAEIEKKEKRQREGIQTKKDRGEWDDYGRPKAQKPDNWDEVIEKWQKGEITAVKAMELTGTKKTTFYKLVKQQGLFPAVILIVLHSKPYIEA